MVLKLYGFPTATCTRRVAVVLYEKNIPFELHTVDLYGGEHKRPEYLEKQPFGQIPYIDDDGFILFESRAIAQYIAAKYADQGTPLLPSQSDLQAYGRHQQASSIELNNFEVFAFRAIWEKHFKLMRGLQTDEAAAAEALKTLDEKLDGYEKILSKQKYLAGDDVTVADLMHLPHGVLLSTIGFTALESGEKPNVARWWKDITSRPSWQAVKESAKAIPAAA